MAANEMRSHWIGTTYIGHLKVDVEGENEIIEALTEAWLKIREDTAVRYARGQIEICPTTGNHHIQCYIEYVRSQRRTRVTKTLPGSYESRRGTRQEAKDYAGKAKSRLCSLPDIGVWVKPKDRDESSRPKDRAIAMVLQGMSPNQIACRDPAAFFTHHHAIKQLFAALNTDEAIREWHASQAELASEEE